MAVVRMSGSAAKATRRDLRRALGNEAIAGLAAHASRINAHELSLAQVHQRIDHLTEKMRDLLAQHVTLATLVRTLGR